MKTERWNSRLGVILAVAGSAVGLGNFLKFPGQVAMYGGAAFMIAYVASFFLIGLPISIVEWTMGRHAGANGYNSPPGIIGFFCGNKKMAYVGIIGAVLTVLIYCYYIYIEAWCLGYAYNFVAGELNFKTLGESGGFFADFIGAAENGDAFGFGSDKVLIFLVFAFLLNFWMIYRGVSRGIELFCKYAMPTLIVLAIVIVVRMMTLSDVSPEHPDRTINQGLGFMWNPVKVLLEKREGNNWVEVRQLVGNAEIDRESARIKSESSASAFGNLKTGSVSSEPRERIRRISIFEQLTNPSIWIAAAGQVFFSLTVGFGAVMTYASYLKRNDDIVLSSLTSCSANEFAFDASAEPCVYRGGQRAQTQIFDTAAWRHNFFHYRFCRLFFGEFEGDGHSRFLDGTSCHIHFCDDSNDSLCLVFRRQKGNQAGQQRFAD
jgi:transporter